LPKVKLKTAKDLKDEESRFEEEIMNKLNRIEHVLAELFEKLEALEEKLGALQTTSAQRFRARGRSKVVVKGRKKRTALEIMKEQGVVFESELKSIANRDSFFEYLRKNGVIVVEGSKERVALTKEFLDTFVAELSKLRGPADAEEKLKDEKLKKLYTILRESGYLVYEKSDWSLDLPRS